MTHFLTGASPDEVWPLVRDYHYSRRMSSNIQHCYGIRAPGGLFGDNGDLLAAVVFSTPATRWSEEVIELSRLVRVPGAAVHLSSLISFACSALKRQGWHLIVSFADWTQRHHGGVYQAAGWSYAGMREPRMDGLIIDGAFKPGRSCNQAFGTQSPSRLADRLPDSEIIAHWDDGKHLYWKALTVFGRGRAKRLGLTAAPYPKPAACPSDDAVPTALSAVQPCEAAP